MHLPLHPEKDYLAAAGLVLPKHSCKQGGRAASLPARPRRRSFLAPAAHGLQNFGWGRERRLGGSRSAELQAAAAATAAAEQQEAEAGGRGEGSGWGGRRGSCRHCSLAASPPRREPLSASLH